MMFSSNQILEISGCLSHKDELKQALEFAIKASGWYEPFTRTKDPAKCVYQITEDGRYCLGWHVGRGWNEFPFDFDIDIISRIIKQHLEKQEVQSGMWDGSYNKGFLLKVIPNSLTDVDGIKSSFHGIVSFEPYTCFYAQ